MRVLITGSRRYSDRESVFSILNATRLIATARGELLTIVHGGCPTGADWFAHEWYCETPNVDEEVWQADWKAQGKAAGPLRNQRMVDAGANCCYAFFAAGEANKGTSDCVKRALEARILVGTVREQQP